MLRPLAVRHYQPLFTKHILDPAGYPVAVFSILGRLLLRRLLRRLRFSRLRLRVRLLRYGLAGLA